jgi:hypothetical protein
MTNTHRYPPVAITIGFYMAWRIKMDYRSSVTLC